MCHKRAPLPSEVERTAESQLTNPPGHLWCDKWTALSGPLSQVNKKQWGIGEESAPKAAAVEAPKPAAPVRTRLLEFCSHTCDCVYKGTSLIRNSPPL